MRAPVGRLVCVLLGAALIASACGDDQAGRLVLAGPEGTPIGTLEDAVAVIEARLQILWPEDWTVAVANDRIVVEAVGTADPAQVEEVVLAGGGFAIRPVLEVSASGVSPLLLEAMEYQAATPSTVPDETATGPAAGGTIPEPGEATTGTGATDITGPPPESSTTEAGTTTSTDVTPPEPGPTTTTLPTEGTTVETVVPPESSTTEAGTTTSTDVTPPEPGSVDLTPVLPEGITVCTPAEAPAAQPGCVDGDTGLTVSDDPTQEAWLADPATGQAFHLGPAQLVGGDLADAQASHLESATGTGPGEWVVTLEFTGEGGDRFEELTRELANFDVGDVRRSFALVLDGQVRSAPQLAPAVTPQTGMQDGRAMITTGSAAGSEQTARELAVLLRCGPLPVDLVRVEP